MFFKNMFIGILIHLPLVFYAENTEQPDISEISKGFFNRSNCKENQITTDKLDKKIQLVYLFINKLRDNTPFTIEDENKFFGKFGGSLGYEFYYQLGMVKDLKWKDSPGKISYIGELVRLNSKNILPAKEDCLVEYFEVVNSYNAAYSGEYPISLRSSSLLSYIIVRFSDHPPCRSDMFPRKIYKTLFFTLEKQDTEYHIELFFSSTDNKFFPELLGANGIRNGRTYFPVDVLNKLKEHIYKMN